MTIALAFPANAQSRLPDIPPAQYDDAQKKAAAEFDAARKAPLTGPFQTMMYSPEVMSRARAMGDYLRFNSAIGNNGRIINGSVTRRITAHGEAPDAYPASSNEESMLIIGPRNVKNAKGTICSTWIQIIPQTE